MEVTWLNVVLPRLHFQRGTGRPAPAHLLQHQGRRGVLVVVGERHSLGLPLRAQSGSGACRVGDEDHGRVAPRAEGLYLHRQDAVRAQSARASKLPRS